MRETFVKHPFDHLLIILCLLALASCQHEPPIPPMMDMEQAVCDTADVTFSGTIVPLIQQRCLGCHSGNDPSGELNFDNWQTLSAVADDGRLRSSVTHDPEGEPMPPNAPRLPLCEVRKFILWIEAGAPNN